MKSFDLRRLRIESVRTSPGDHARLPVAINGLAFQGCPPTGFDPSSAGLCTQDSATFKARSENRNYR